MVSKRSVSSFLGSYSNTQCLWPSSSRWPSIEHSHQNLRGCEHFAPCRSVATGLRRETCNCDDVLRSTYSSNIIDPLYRGPPEQGYFSDIPFATRDVSPPDVAASAPPYYELPTQGMPDIVTLVLLVQFGWVASGFQPVKLAHQNGSALQSRSSGACPDTGYSVLFTSVQGENAKPKSYHAHWV